jgi:hypothetical protein
MRSRMNTGHSISLSFWLLNLPFLEASSAFSVFYLLTVGRNTEGRSAG